MGLINKIFGKTTDSAPKKALPWIQLTILEQLDEVEKQSFKKPVVIFKHSTRCGTSSMVLRHFTNDYSFPEEGVYLYFLDLLSYRDISNEIAVKFQVLHQSPQLLVIKNGQVVHHASHYHIQVEDIATFIEKE
jgi:bacillithiol system protein YtxJ